MKWFSISFWEYLLEKPNQNRKRYCGFWKRFWCRANGHQQGIIWHNANGLEPDYRCKNCYDDLG